MKSLFNMSEEIVREVKQGFELKLTSEQLMERIDQYLDKNMYTEGMNRRYPKYYGESLRCTAMAVKYQFQEEYIVFGYWYEGAFYATRKNAKKFGLNSTEELHALNLTQAQWDKLPRANCYTDLKPYYQA